MFFKKYLTIILFLLLINFSYTLFGQEGEDNSNSLTLKFRGSSELGAIALIVSNRAPIAVEINQIVQDFVKNDFRIALVPQDYTYNLEELNNTNNPFNKEVKFVIKISVHNVAPTEQLINVSVEILRLSDSKLISKDMAGPRSNIRLLTAQIRKLLYELAPSISYTNPTITSVQGETFIFPLKNFPGLRRGDEIKIRYADSREGRTESVGIVYKMSNDMVIAKDIHKKVKDNDQILRGTPQRNRFYINLGMIVPTLGESLLVATLNGNTWQGDKRWPVGFKIEGEYERFLPYQLVSTTVFGLNIDRNAHTYLMTGIGYRAFVNTWEFVPYFRLGFMYSPVGLRIIEGDMGNLQGFTLRLGINIGLNIVKRVSNSIFVGVDIGAQYFPVDLVSVLSNSEEIEPQWKNKGQFTDKFPMTQLFPYLSIKVGWLF